MKINLNENKPLKIYFLNINFVPIIMPQNVTSNPIPKLTFDFDFELDLDSWSHPPFLLNSNYKGTQKLRIFSYQRSSLGYGSTLRRGSSSVGMGSVVTF